ncbi:mechanosensitive ion channel [Porticoccus sp. W117]|uniref:mechanosensitive ion channel family protein n=1 Tax=Porticoccus sp. W117 TaxID=3054777 RepID=UPI0025971544|nr:mechanosensitive ion channel domain-containing protein [Porticoccus sp. W117]MDM3870398.1 mechanosensitive ion channel [Porticoccus sp. W117]
MENQQEYIDKAVELAMTHGPKLLLALLVLVIGWWLSNRVVKLMHRTLVRTNAEPTLVKFLQSIVGIILKMVVLIIFATTIGVETASLIAIMGAAGLAVGLALQGSLANFAGGVLILFFKPFKAGDEIEAQGYRGVVQEIQIFNTILLTRDNEKIVIPNGNLSNGCLKNIFAEPTRRVDMTYGISYEDDIGKAKQVIADVLAADENILKEPAPDIFVSAHADSSINILVRPWCKSEHFWDVHFGTMENVKLAFDREGISIPYPQRDLHIKTGQVSSS